MIDDAMIAGVHKLANERLYRRYPLLDMADLSKHPKGHFEKDEIEFILEAYIDIQRATESNNINVNPTRSKRVRKVPAK